MFSTVKPLSLFNLAMTGERHIGSSRCPDSTAAMQLLQTSSKEGMERLRMSAEIL
jgi:hypothetical protein